MGVIFQAFAVGIPRPKGSKSRGRAGKSGYSPMYEASKHLPAWMDAVRTVAFQEASGVLVECPVSVDLEFWFKRPLSHYTRGKNPRLKPDAPSIHAQKPDTDKLIRAVLDALTGIVWVDDSLVWCVGASRWWSEELQGVQMTVWDDVVTF